MDNLVQQYVDIWNTQQVGQLLNIFSSSSTYKDPMQEGNAVKILSTSIQETILAFPDMTFEILTIIKGSPDQLIVLEWLMRGTNKGSFFGASPTGKKIHILGVDIFQINGERISVLKSFYDSNQFTTQLSL